MSEATAFDGSDAVRDETVGSDDWDDTLSLSDADEWYEEEPEAPLFGWVLPTLAVLAVVGWTAFFAWAYRADLLGVPTPREGIALFTQWAIPVLLLIGSWLVMMRSSAREGTRFADVSRNLARESRDLETRLQTVNSELVVAREFIAAQARDLEALGRTASERISEHAERLQALVRENGAQVDAIATVSARARDNMESLRSDLPVIANSARDVSNQIGAAGNTAHDQLGELVAGFERLNTFGEASERQVVSLQERIDAALDNFRLQTEQLETIAEARFGALGERSEQFRTELDSREVDALAAMRRRVDELESAIAESRSGLEDHEEEALRSLRLRLTALRDESGTIANSVRDAEADAAVRFGERVDELRIRLTEVVEELRAVDEKVVANANAKMDALLGEGERIDGLLEKREARFLASIAKHQVELADAEKSAIRQLEDQLVRLDGLLGERLEAQQAEAARLVENGEALAARMAEIEPLLERVSARSVQAREDLCTALDTLGEKNEATREILSGTEQSVAAVTDASVRLLEIIQAAARQSGEDLPHSIGQAEQRLAEVREGARSLSLMLDKARDKGEALSAYVLAAREESGAAVSDIDSAQGAISGRHATLLGDIETMQGRLETLAERHDSVGASARDNWQEALGELERAANATLASLGKQTDEEIRAVAMRIGDASADAVEGAIRERAGSAIADLEGSAGNALDMGRETTQLLRDQLARLNELTGNLEQRIARAHERAEEQVDNDFARRMALISESLNSNSIDIAEALSTEVSDTAWASYLRGDRGIFTRKAVRLVDSGEAREIVEVYEADDDFRIHVNRYIHDFEAMLRDVLSTRDGNAMGVTLLSSDMGKLYVVLAQAIERLRD